jgi:hypothetical protein
MVVLSAVLVFEGVVPPVVVAVPAEVVNVVVVV